MFLALVKFEQIKYEVETPLFPEKSENTSAEITCSKIGHESVRPELPRRAIVHQCLERVTFRRCIKNSGANKVNY